jgi:hypothetical protein
MKKTSSLQIALGCVLALLLQPLSLWIVWTYLSPKGGWQFLGAPFVFAGLYLSLIPVVHFFVVPSFGVAQALTILPATVIFYLGGKHDILRGLLLVGTGLALLNVGVSFYAYFLQRL